jgi:Lambda phage tail tape-measure protein (Tape_meas_lam_C)
MADIGSLVVKLAAETAEFREDLGKSARLLEKHADGMRSSLERVAEVAKTTFAIAVGVESVGALKELISHTLETVAALQDFAEQTGASAVALSGFAPVATISGVAMEQISVGLTKLSKGLAGVDDETKGASQALAYLGIKAKDSGGNLRDPAEVMNEIALKLSDFEDGAGKTAIALELFGKSGATLLPFLKDLAANQDLNIRMTQAEIESAEQASKALGRMKAEHNFVAQTIVTAALPAMEELVGQLKEVVLGTHNSAEAMVRLRDDGTLKEWAQDAAVGLAIVIDAMRGLIQMVKSVIGSFEAVWADMELLGTFIAGGKGLNPFSEENQATLKAALEKRNAIVEKANQNYVDLWKMPLLADAVKSRFDAINKGEAEATGGAKPKLNYNSATGALTAGAMAQIESDIKKLQGLTDVESGILKDRQKIIDLYESQGYISFKEASEARLNAQQDFTDKLGDLYGQEETILKRGLATVAKTTQDKLKLQDKLSEITLRREKLERDAQQSNLEREIKLPGETLKDIQEQVARSQNQLRATEEQIKVLKDSGAISEVESLKRLSAARKSSAEELADFAAKARELVEAAPGNDKLADSFKRIEEAARQATDGAQLLGQRAFELADPGAGFSKALRTLGEETEQVGKQMEAVTTRAFNGMTDALTNFVMTGKLDFRTLATSIISDLIRIQIQRSITLPMANALGGMFGFANGGVMTSAGPLPLRTYAGGGVASSPQLAVFGEGSMNEAYVPLPDGRSIPVTMSQGGSGAGDVFNISVNVAEGGTTSTAGQGQDLGRAISSAVRQELLNQKRAGGLLDTRRMG